MWTRRQCLFAALAGPAARLTWSDLRPPAQDLARRLDLTPDNWAAWQNDRRGRLADRMVAGNAEHVTYFFLQSRAFTTIEPVEPMAAARTPGLPAAEARMRAFSGARPRDRRHEIIARLERWDLGRCYSHTLEFLRAKEVDQRPLDRLYFNRGLSSDTSPASTLILGEIPEAPQKILLAGPGLDLTRREKFTDDLPLRSHQYDHLRRAYPHAVIDLADVRPEVIEVLGAQRVDVTTERAGGAYDLIVATNLLLYFEDRELLTTLAGFAVSLKPGGRLLHNDQRFAAKVFGEACGIPVEQFTPRQTGPRHWDRAVIHRKESAG